MKKITIIVFSVIVIALSGCLKDKTNVDLSNVGALVEMPYSGVGSFSTDALNFSSDTITQTFTINLASPYPLNRDVTVTVGIDTSLVALRNAADTSVRYAVMPASAYSSFPDQTVTIKAGTRLDTLNISFYNPALDPTVSYMLPIVIKSVSDKSVTISGNMGVHYFHAIGDPIAGTYKWAYTRWQSGDTTTSPNGASFSLAAGNTAVFSPVSPTQVEVQSGYGAQNGFNVRYELSFTNTSGVLSNPTVALNTSDIKNNLNPASITVLSDAKILFADLQHQHFRFIYQVVNGSGATRTLIDEFTK